ncbi:hypothetical protein [Serratia sp. UGAL515B_01]|uniref:COG4315 family predicted lipoprotein n=1 Tax=Serratia sp. UGAL515B_01 TaxID=2986763 RepID=UPI002952E77F|nr:hypothetical protein [Serratia sp. UGAL515B_01]WON78599.1 hypothetical protein OK023_08225 [Serratia sp. UGAL515B_01]
MMRVLFIPVLIGFMAFSAFASDISIKETSLGQVYTNSQGMTLYHFDSDKEGQSSCYDECAKAWLPLLVTGESSRSPGLGKIERKDGKFQWALNRRPLYLWHKDQHPGDITGAGVKNTWSLACSMKCSCRSPLDKSRWQDYILRR